MLFSRSGNFSHPDQPGHTKTPDREKYIANHAWSRGIVPFGKSAVSASDLFCIALASLDVRLRLDETGAEFLSTGEAGVIGEFGDGDEPYKADHVRRFIFNRPFFIAMKEPNASEPNASEPNASEPWFVAWIANTALMEHFDKP